MLARRGALLALLFATTLPLFAARERFIVRHRGAELAGSEVCFFRSGDMSDPFALFLAGREVRCFAADRVLDIPPGRWFFFARHGDDLVSAQLASISGRAAELARDAYGEAQIDLLPAATLDLTKIESSRGPDESFALYADNDGTDTRPALIPITPGTTTALVPAGARVLVLKLRFSRVVDVSEPIVADRRTIVPPFPPLAPDRAHVLAWTEFRDEARDPDAEWRRIPAPQVALTIGGTRIAPAIAPRAGFGSDGALMLFRNVPLGKATLTAGGGVWSRDDVAVDATRSGVILPRGAVIAPASALTVRWSGTIPRQASDCGGHTEPLPSVRLLSCEMTPCREIATSSQHIATFDALRPGSYAVIVGDERSNVTLQLGQRTTHDVELHAFHILGRVTVDGQPVRARLEFRSGSAATDDDGRYEADLLSAPRDVPVRVFDCRDGHLLQTSVPSHPLEANQPYDIDIRHNRIKVDVVDADSRRSLPGVAIQLAAMKAKDEVNFVTGGTITTGDDGSAQIVNVLTNHPVAVCAQSQRYERACSDELAFGDKSELTVKIALRLKDRFHGVIRSTAEVQSGRIFFVGPDNKVTEWSTVQPDGTFVHRLSHASPEWVVVASSRPLFVAPLGEGEIALTMPAAPARDVTVTAPRDALVTLFVGDRRIPEHAFSWHQSRHESDSILRAGVPLHIPQVFDVAPISVGLGPSPYELPANFEAGPDVDFCSIPGFASCARKALTADNRIAF